MDIASGLAALKTASDLTRSLRDAVKSGGIKDDEISGRIGEIYDYIIDSKAALIDASEEIHNLKGQVNWVCLLYDDGPTPRRIEPLLIFTDVEIPVGIEVAAQV
jgi:hypothetical protein